MIRGMFLLCSGADEPDSKRKNKENSGPCIALVAKAPRRPEMRTYMISYDLAKPTANQSVLAQTIMGLGDKWARPLTNTWYVASDRDEVDLEADLQALLSDDDGLVIQAVKREAAMTNTSLRWFRQRRAPSDVDGGENVIAFPAPTTDTPDEPELPLAKAS